MRVHRGVPPELRMVAWEVTRSCNLQCVHCRASASQGPYEGELSTAEAMEFLEDLASFSRPVVIVTGGEPLLRCDVLELARRGTELGLKMVMAVNGTLINHRTAKDLKEAGIQRISISLDGATRASHDDFRGVEGAFDGAMEGIRIAREHGLPVQINTTLTPKNIEDIPRIMELAINVGAVAHHIFLLVPTGRGRGIADDGVSAQKYEEVLKWFCQQQHGVPLQLKATCAPQYQRISREVAPRGGAPVEAVTRGCLAGWGFCFLSHVGEVQPCGYLEVSCGSIRQQKLSEIWPSSEVLNKLRNVELYGGKCGKCEYRRVCGGCRARAYEATGNFLAEEPLCVYEPQGAGKTV